MGRGIYIGSFREMESKPYFNLGLDWMGNNLGGIYSNCCYSLLNGFWMCFCTVIYYLCVKLVRALPVLNDWEKKRFS